MALCRTLHEAGATAVACARWFGRVVCPQLDSDAELDGANVFHGGVAGVPQRTARARLPNHFVQIVAVERVNEYSSVVQVRVCARQFHERAC